MKFMIMTAKRVSSGHSRQGIHPSIFTQWNSEGQRSLSRRFGKSYWGVFNRGVFCIVYFVSVLRSDDYFCPPTSDLRPLTSVSFSLCMSACPVEYLPCEMLSLFLWGAVHSSGVANPLFFALFAPFCLPC